MGVIQLFSSKNRTGLPNMINSHYGGNTEDDVDDDDDDDDVDDDDVD